MVLTRDELIASLQHEVRILVHLCSKIDPSMLDYRPTPKQRSTMELLRYLTTMGPHLVRNAKTGQFDLEGWQAAAKEAEARDFAQTVAALAAHSDIYAKELAGWSDADFRVQIEMFGNKSSRGQFIVNLVLGGCAAYRTQLFLYLKACGREELTTMNLWGGVDAPAPAVAG
ncbi:MAG TPA: hypothetical protein VFV95_02125 [Vicinamibacterales bacterium]|nr:hypothetical protein [Vicinamibacterales bacterium]